MLNKSLLLASLLVVCSTVYADNKRFLLINHTTSAVCMFQASAVYKTSWEEDILGASTIDTGDTKLINLEDGTSNCYYDTKTTLCDGRESYRYRMNACTSITLSIGD